MVNITKPSYLREEALRMKLEQAKPEYESQIKKLLAECDLPHEDIRSSQLQHFWVACENTRLAGVVGLEILGNHALLRSLAVTPHARSKGLGKQLTVKAEQHARSFQVGTLYLLTLTAAEFFIKLGYQIMKREDAPATLQNTTEFQGICPVSAKCMTKSLKPDQGT
jgi:amino-acid N-acetyltransferase